MTGSADKIQKYRELLKLDPRSGVFVLLAEELCAAGEWDEAAEVCREGLRFHPDNMRAQALFGMALMETGEAEESEGILLKLAEEIGRNSVIFKVLCEFAASAGQIEQAGEFERIYNSFNSPRPDERPFATSGASVEKELKQPAKSAELESFKAEAVEELLGVDMEAPPDVAAPEEAVAAEPEMDEDLEIENLMSLLAERIDEKFRGVGTPGPMLAEEDKEFIRKEIVSRLSAETL